MTTINRFQIKNLHGYKNFDLRLADNTLILVGENGAGKTTVLNLFYYLLSGQWSSMAKYQFEEVSITIGSKKYTLLASDFEKSLHEIVDRRIFHRLPPFARRKFMALLEEKEGRLVTPELEMLCHQYDIPLEFLLHELDLFENTSKKKTDPLRQTLEGIKASLNAQLLYLPTYRRIEQELNLIFKGVDDRELRNRRELLTARRGDDTFVELIEFGMKDVENAINNTLSKLNSFARENLNNLTFGYLGDIVEQQYSTVDLKSIKDASEQTIDNILNRIQEHILSSKNKQHLREIIEGVKKNETQTEHTKVTCHYFTKLMAFQKDIETKEARIMSFCEVCNDYMVDKEFKYDISDFSFTIRPKGGGDATREIKLHHLSSGEKQIVSLFSHLYLSGGKSYFVLIDEPELSLSVPWQRKILMDIRKADFCTGLVAVTHSPFIYDNDLKKYAHGLGEFVV
ncbi:MAG: AAA family ATPase [Syntrophales bacterium]|jgi:predicted ATP-dependent endonuclease of OLD family